MAVIDLGKCTIQWSNGVADKTNLYAIRGVNTGDSIDLGADFVAPKIALFLSTTTSQKGVCTIAGTVITIPTANLAGDAGYLLVWGSSS
jgi:hypothetical protein